MTLINLITRINTWVLQAPPLVSPARSPASTDDDVLIMDGVLVDNGPGTPSSARRSVSFADNNGSNNRRSVSISVPSAPGAVVEAAVGAAAPVVR